MSSNSTEVDGFFDNIGGGGAPSATLKDVDDFVVGEIVDQYKVEAKKFGTDQVEIDERTGKPVIQLVVVLQTELRNWAGVSKIPVVDVNVPPAQQVQKDPSEDDGRRAVYVKPGHNLHAAIGQAIVAGTGKRGNLQIGGQLGVKIDRLEPTRKGNPKKVHAVKYTPPAASAGFFEGSNQAAQPQGQAPAQSAPVQQVQQTAPAQTAPAAQPTGQANPWGTTQSGNPPF